jgi:CRP/FNR family cyclic AMP-dependent transcriptional regulator
MKENRNRIRTRLGELPLLAGAPASLLDRLVAAGIEMTLAAGEVILAEGTANDSIYLILSGEVGVRLDDGGGKGVRVSQVQLARLSTGEIFGEYSMFDGEKVSASVVARTATDVVRFRGEALRRELAADPEAGRRVYSNLILMLVRRLRAKDAEIDLVTIG